MTTLRKLIIIKAATNILYATAFNINKFLLMIFDGRRAYYNITGHMAAEYVLSSLLSNFERLVVYSLNMMPNLAVLVYHIEKLTRTGFLASTALD